MKFIKLKRINIELLKSEENLARQKNTFLKDLQKTQEQTNC